jgi:pyridoxamine 5'-phosphate oxidase
MTDAPLIPASPSEDDYVRQVTEATPPALLSEERPNPPVRRLAGGGRQEGAQRSQRHGRLDRRRRRHAGLAHGAAQERRCAGLRLLHQHPQRQGLELGGQPKAALLFHWKSLRRQVRMRGVVEPVSEAEADAYFASRARHSQLGAWASDQSRPLPDRLALEKRVAEMALKFGLGKVPRPPHWSGYRIVPTSSSSGATARSACTSGWSTRATARAGERRGCTRRMSS